MKGWRVCSIAFWVFVAALPAKAELPIQRAYDLWLSGAEAWLNAEFQLAAERWLELVENFPESALAVAASADLVELSQIYPATSEKLFQIAQLIEGRGWLSAECRRRLMEGYCHLAWRENRTVDARRAAELSGGAWQWTLGRVHGRAMELMDRFYSGQPLPFEPFSSRDCAVCGRRTFYDSNGSGLFLGSRKVSLAEDAVFYIVFESSAPAGLRIDGQTVLVHDLHRRRMARERRLLVEMPAGDHFFEFALDAQQGEEQIGIWLVPLKLSTKSIESDPKLKKFTRLSFRELELVPESGDRHAGWLLEAVLSLLEGRSDRAFLWLEELVRAGYRSELVRFWLSKAYLNYLEEVPELARQKAKRQLEKIAGEKTLAAYLLVQLLLQEDGDFTQTMVWIRRLQQSRPDVYLGYWLEGMLLEKSELDLEAAEAYRKALAMEPRAHQVAEQLLRLALSRKDLVTARALFESYPFFEDDDQFFGFLRNSGRNQRAEEVLRRKMETCPFQPHWPLQLAELLLEEGRLPESRQMVYRVLDIIGEEKTGLKRLFDLLQLLQEEKADSLLERLLRLYPSDVHLQLLAAAESGKRTLKLPGEIDVDTVALVKEASARPCRQEVASERILDQATVQFFPDGQQLTRIHILVRVNNQEGVAKWGEIEAPGENTLIEALRTIKADGRFYNAEFLAGKETVSLPQLVVGDFVEVKILAGRTASPLVPTGAGWFYGPWYFASQDEDVRLSRLVLVFPRQQSWRLQRVGDAPEPQELENQDWRILRFEVRDRPAMVLENMAPPPDEIFPSVQVATVGWEVIGAFLGEQLVRLSRPDEVLRQLAFSISGGPRSGRRAAEKLFYWVMRNIRQEGDFEDFSIPAELAVARRQGNRLVVLCSLLAALGLEFRPMLARPLYAPPLDEQVPRAGVFVSPVVEVSFPGESLWLQPQEDFQAAGLLGEELLGQPALLLSPLPNRPPWIYLPDSQKDKYEQRIELELHIQENGTMRGKGREVFQPLAAVKLRRSLAGLSAAARQRILHAGLVGAYPGSQLEKWRIENLQQPNLPLIVDFEFYVPDALEKRSGGWLLRGEFFPYRLHEQLAPQANRRLPLLVAEPVRVSSQVLIEVPLGWSVELPAAMKLKAPLSRFEYRSTRSRRGWLLEKRVEILPGRVAGEDWKKFKEFLQKISQLESAAIIFNLPSKD